MQLTTQLPQTGRVWIYQANRALTDADITLIEKELDAFIAGWQAHGQSLEAGFEIRYHRFLLVGVNENFQAATGCSIDDSVRKITELGRCLDIDFMDRSLVATWQPNEEIKVYPLKNIPQLIKDGVLDQNCIVFNNAIQQLEQLSYNWKVPAKDSWMKRYFA